VTNNIRWATIKQVKHKALSVKLEVLNSTSVLLSLYEEDSHELKPVVIDDKWIAILKWLIESVSNTIDMTDHIQSYTSLLMVFNIKRIPISDHLATLQKLISSLELEASFLDVHKTCDTDTHKPDEDILRLPVFYDKEKQVSDSNDLTALSERLDLSTDEIIDLHQSLSYKVFALGFSPGFAFMGDLDSRLQVPRLSSPRTKVPKGSVAIAEKQTAIYPLESPGGWHLLGCCPIKLFDPRRKPNNLFSIGQSIRFEAVDEATFNTMAFAQGGIYEKEADSISNSLNNSFTKDKAIEVIKANGLNIVVDQGRKGMMQQGLSESGPMDRLAFAAANQLLGNDANAAMIEISLGGLSIAIHQDTVMAISGADLQAELIDKNGDIKPLSPWLSYRLSKGSRLTFKGFKQQGFRTYLSFLGGIILPPEYYMGQSVSCVQREELGGHKANGQALASGDYLAIAPIDTDDYRKVQLKAIPYRYRGFFSEAKPFTRVYKLPIRLCYQVALFDKQQVACFLQQVHTVSSQIDRMAYRLQSENKLAVPKQGIVSEGIALGSMQITPDGEPIIMMADRQTIGGYPKLGVLLEETVNTLAQLVPGQKVQFVAVNEM